MAHFVHYDLPEQVKQKIVRLRWQIAANQTLLACYRLEQVLRKANFNPNQPRVPRGSSDGGQWTGSGTNAGSAKPRATVPKVPKPRLDIPLAGKPDKTGTLEQPPHIPSEPPATSKLRNAAIKRAAKWLGKAALKHAIPEIGLYLDIIDAATWIHDSYPDIQSYFDPPKSLDELQRAVAADRTPGYENHHIAEQSAAKDDGFPRSLIDSRDNLVRIPTFKHREITEWFRAPNEDFGGQSPREYLRGRDWSERVRVGKKALVESGVLKP